MFYHEIVRLERPRSGDDREAISTLYVFSWMICLPAQLPITFRLDDARRMKRNEQITDDEYLIQCLFVDR